MSATADLTVPRLLKMSQSELDDLYTNSPSGDIPDGDCERAGCHARRYRDGRAMRV